MIFRDRRVKDLNELLLYSKQQTRRNVDIYRNIGTTKNQTKERSREDTRRNLHARQDKGMNSKFTLHLSAPSQIFHKGYIHRIYIYIYIRIYREQTSMNQEMKTLTWNAEAQAIRDRKREIFIIFSHERVYNAKITKSMRKIHEDLDRWIHM